VGAVRDGAASVVLAVSQVLAARCVMATAVVTAAGSVTLGGAVHRSAGSVVAGRRSGVVTAGVVSHGRPVPVGADQRHGQHDSEDDESDEQPSVDG
jgi:hypothetical protein